MIMRIWLHRKFNIHHWKKHDDGGQIDKRRCHVCGRIDWFNFLKREWFEKSSGVVV